MATAIPLLIEFGQSPWYDNLTRRSRPVACSRSWTRTASAA